MLEHPQDFIPFIPSVEGEDGFGATDSSGILSPSQFAMYCAAVRDTGVWGGEPEILALSRHFDIPIVVVQAGPQPIVVHSPHPDMEPDPSGRSVKISYHRRMYGLGEVSNRNCTYILTLQAYFTLCSTTILCDPRLKAISRVCSDILCSLVPCRTLATLVISHCV